MADKAGQQDSIWAQSTKDVNSSKNDAEALKIFGQMTNGGIVSTETKNKRGTNQRM